MTDEELIAQLRECGRETKTFGADADLFLEAADRLAAANRQIASYSEAEKRQIARAEAAETRIAKLTEALEKIARSYNLLRSAKIADAALTALARVAARESGLTPWLGWDQSNPPWSEAKHKDAVCFAAFRQGFSVEDAAALIGFIEQTWPRATGNDER